MIHNDGGPIREAVDALRAAAPSSRRSARNWNAGRLATSPCRIRSCGAPPPAADGSRTALRYSQAHPEGPCTSRRQATSEHPPARSNSLGTDLIGFCVAWLRSTQRGRSRADPGSGRMVRRDTGSVAPDPANQAALASSPEQTIKLSSATTGPGPPRSIRTCVVHAYGR